MTKKPASATLATPPVAARGHVLSELFADGDLVDGIFAYLLELLPEIRDQAPELKVAIRRHIGGQRHYVRATESDPDSTAREVLRLFNGRNATEVARRLNIGRTTVYRFLKQHGRAE
jgi:transcriptional regulator of acetoin/glycerol metabolism